MTTELNTPQPEVADNNSLREVLLFCAVLVVEVYSLAVAFGGPFFEVGYFLLVVISQTTAGAYIWAQLRRTDKSLPLPELLAMGFAIGSASAAISQLIIRDLLGIRLFFSPLVPIIGVAIWLVIKRNTRLPLTITHANTNTLIWLLFPAPLAMSFHEWRLYALFVIPFLIAVLVFYKKQIFRTRYLLFSVGLLSLVFGVITKATNSVSIANGLIGYDEIFDEALSIGFSNWGISDHIGRIGDSIAYYKLGHVWLGPILELTNSPPMIVTTSILPLIVFLFIGLALWGLTFQFHKSSKAAGIGAVLFFVQSTFPEPENLAIRLAQCLVVVYFLTAITALVKCWSSDLIESLVAAFFIFIIFGTRAQYGLLFLVGFALFKGISLLKRDLNIKNLIFHGLSISISLVTCFLIFFNTNLPQVSAQAKDSYFRLTILLFSYVGLRSLIPLIVSFEKPNKQTKFIYSIISAAILTYFVVPQTTILNAPSLTIALLVSVQLAKVITRLPVALTKNKLIVIAVMSTLLGFATRLFYDLFKWRDLTGLNQVIKFFATKAVEDKSIALVTTVPFLTLTFVILMIERNRIFVRLRIFLIAMAMSFGVSIAVNLRQVSNYFRYGVALRGEIEPNSTKSWYTDTDRITGLEWMQQNTAQDDIFAQNTSIPDYRSTEYSASLILSGSIHRRAFIEGTYSPELQFDYPRDPKLQTPRLREQLKRLDTSFNFPISPSMDLLKILKETNVKWFVVDLGNTELRDWEPWATTRFMNEKVAILELAQLPAPSN